MRGLSLTLEGLALGLRFVAAIQPVEFAAHPCYSRFNDLTPKVDKLPSGPNQHFIPKFVQKPFGVRPKRKSIWFFAKGVEPEEKAIKRVASEDFFYSVPSADGSPTLDDDITDAETPLSDLLHCVRTLTVGSRVNASDAAEIITHLAPRTAHFRATMERGLRLIASGTVELISDEDKLQALVGLDQDAPNEQFRVLAAKQLQDFDAINRVRTGQPGEGCR